MEQSKKWHPELCSPPLYVRPIRDIRIMEAELGYKQRINGGNIPITVGILIADSRRQYCRENIITQLGQIDKASGPLIDFFLPGYDRIIKEEKIPIFQFKFKKRTYSFNSDEFDRVVEVLEAHGIKVTGRAQLLLVPYENNRLCLSDAMMFDLEKEEASGRIESTRLFIKFIIKIAKKTTEFEKFKRTIQRDRSRTAFLAFLKAKLPDIFWEIVTYPFP